MAVSVILSVKIALLHSRVKDRAGHAQSKKCEPRGTTEMEQVLSGNSRHESDGREDNEEQQRHCDRADNTRQPAVLRPTDIPKPRIGAGKAVKWFACFVACLVVVYPTTPLRRIVGSDILHALILVGVSALGHLGLGSVNFRLLAALLVGSIPGVWLGSRMSLVFPEKILRPVLAGTLLFLGYKLL